MLVKPEHIYRNQDTDTAYDNLPWKEQLDCNCTQLATCTCPLCPDAPPKPYILPTGHTASLEVDGTCITSHIASAIKEASFCSDFIKYVIHQSGRQDPMIFHSIDWEARACVSLHSPPGQHITIFKLESCIICPHVLPLQDGKGN